jgi:chromosome segregation ATPase
VQEKSMQDNERVNKTLSDLKNAQNKLNDLDREHNELMTRLENAKRAQKRMTYYLIAIVVVAAGMIIGSLYFAATSL